VSQKCNNQYIYKFENSFYIRLVVKQITLGILMMAPQEIVLIGVDNNLIQVIAAYLGDKYRFIAINRKFDIRQLQSYSNIILFIIDTDCVFLEVEALVFEIKSTPTYQNIPAIGLSFKQHFAQMNPAFRNQFEDFLLKPMGNEDLLTRIEVWVRTFEIVNNDEVHAKSYSLDTLS